MKNIVTLTIAVPAFNEQDNISILLKSILRQKKSGIKLEKILVVSDGSTDKTNKIVARLSQKNKIINLIQHYDRQGKVKRLNEIYRTNTSDYLVVLDADILLIGNKFILQLVNEMETNKKVVLLASHQIPTRANNFIARIIYAAYKVWDDTRLAVPNQIHIQNFYGAATIYRRKFVERLKIPISITDERGYIYLKAIKEGVFRYTFSAAIYYRPVETLHDLWKLGDRSFGKNQDVLASIFGEQVYEIYNIPFRYKIRSIINNFIKSPVYTGFGLILNILIRIFPIHDVLYQNGMWESSRSTKKAIKL